MLFKNLFLFSLLFLLSQIHCNKDFGDNRGPLYDIRQISVGQHNVYIRREIRGRNYDGLSISSDPNLCVGPSQTKDFFVNSETVSDVFYKVEGDELQIYSLNVFSPPQSGDNFPVKIVQRKLSPGQYSKENAITLGYAELGLKDDSLKYCQE